MTEKFLKLDEEKQKRIIHAALKEFAEKGYEQASTNQIVKEAGIGKGMLFYYFETKEKLFNYLVNYCLDILGKHFLSFIPEDSPDFIEKLAGISKLKFKFYTEFPLEWEFLSRFFVEHGLELPEEARKKYEEIYAVSMEKFFGNNRIDKSLFRDDIDAEKAFQLIQWAIKGYQNELLKRFKNKTVNMEDVEPLWDEFDEYLEILKTCFYK